MLLEKENHGDENFKRFIKSFRTPYESKIYGDQEYYIRNVNRDRKDRDYWKYFFKYDSFSEKRVERVEYDSYSGRVEYNGDISISRDYDENVYVDKFEIYRRGLDSFIDEEYRFLEYCRFTVKRVYDFCKSCIEDYTKACRYPKADLITVFDVVRKYVEDYHFECNDYYAIEARKVTVDLMKKYLRVNHPWGYTENVDDHEIWYPFISTIIGPEEEAFTDEWKKTHKKLNNEYWLQREEIHFKYMEREMKRREYEDNVAFRERMIRKNPLKSAAFFVPLFGLIAVIIFLTIFLIAKGPASTESTFAIIVCIPIFAIFLGFLIKKLKEYGTYKFYLNKKIEKPDLD